MTVMGSLRTSKLGGKSSTASAHGSSRSCLFLRFFLSICIGLKIVIGNREDPPLAGCYAAHSGQPDTCTPRRERRIQLRVVSVLEGFHSEYLQPDNGRPTDGGSKEKEYKSDDPPLREKSVEPLCS